MPTLSCFSPYRTAFLPLVAFGVYACEDGGSLNEPTRGGAVEVTTTTSGAEPDGDGYLIQMDGGPAVPIGASGTRNFSDVAPGGHAFRVDGLAPNCTITGDNPRAVTVISGETASLTFQVTCEATTGDLSVTAATSGPSPDPDGYLISVDGIERGAIGVNATVVVSGLTQGDHALGLNGISGNCQIEGENLRTVTVPAGGDVSVSYAIICTTPPASAGSLKITTATSGSGADPDGYSFALDGGPATPIGANTSTTLQNLSPGVHMVRLAGLSQNCSLQGPDSQSATVTSGATAEVSFAVVCAATLGSVNVTVTSSGSPADPDGYLVTLDNAGTGQSVPGNGAVTFTDVPPGSHGVTLSGLASNCQADPSSKTIAVIAGQTAEASFAVTCSSIGPTTGTIEVTTATTGASPDPDGYAITLDNGTPQPIGVGATITFSDVSAGQHQLELAGQASNCTVQGDNPRSVAVTAGQQAQVVFTLTCGTAGQIQWSLISFPSGFTGLDVWASSATDIYAVGRSAYRGTILHYDGQNWNDQPIPPNSEQGIPTAVWGSGPNDVYAAGYRMIYHKTGAAWVTAHTSQITTFEVLGGASAQTVFAGGGEPTATGLEPHIMQYNGQEWVFNEEEFFEDGSFHDMTGRTATDAWVVGLQWATWQPPPEEPDLAHQVFHWDGTSWKRNYTIMSFSGQPSDALNGIWPVAANDVFMVGDRGRILRYDGLSWTSMASPSSANLRDVWASSATDVFAVGDGGILRYDGATWSIINDTKGTRVWGSGGDVFVLTENGVLHGTR